MFTEMNKIIEQFYKEVEEFIKGRKDEINNK